MKKILITLALSVLLYPPTLEAQNKSKKSKKQPELTTQAPKNNQNLRHIEKLYLLMQ